MQKDEQQSARLFLAVVLLNYTRSVLMGWLYVYQKAYFLLMAFLVDRNQICVSKCHKQISEIFQKTNGHYGAILLHKRRPFPMLALQSH